MSKAWWRLKCKRDAYKFVAKARKLGKTIPTKVLGWKLNK